MSMDSMADSASLCSATLQRPLSAKMPQAEMQVGTTVTTLKAGPPVPTTLRGTCGRRFHRLPPGMTGNNHQRHFVMHDYHDHSNEAAKITKRSAPGDTLKTVNHGCVFPLKLHDILSDAEHKGFDHIISWASHGRCFMVHEPKLFAECVLPLYFQLSKITSFQRQLNLYDFCRLYHGQDRGCYYHEFFLRGLAELAQRMVRFKNKGTRIKSTSNPDAEPDIYAMPPIVDEDHTKQNLHERYQFI